MATLKNRYNSYQIIQTIYRLTYHGCFKTILGLPIFWIRVMLKTTILSYNVDGIIPTNHWINPCFFFFKKKKKKKKTKVG